MDVGRFAAVAEREQPKIYVPPMTRAYQTGMYVVPEFLSSRPARYTCNADWRKLGSVADDLFADVYQCWRVACPYRLPHASPSKKKLASMIGV